jgi:hypothetical protein
LIVLINFEKKLPPSVGVDAPAAGVGGVVVVEPDTCTLCLKHYKVFCMIITIKFTSIIYQIFDKLHFRYPQTSLIRSQ